MKVFQTIHKYTPHIPQFEAKYGINDDSDISFEDMRKLIIDDGYASAYILLPALQNKTNEVFYTIWNYERLQLLWAKENRIKTTDLEKIKLEQLKAFNPDVFYNHSPFADGHFVELVKIAGIKCKNICWNGIIETRPMTFPLYDVHLTLHRPYIYYWNKLGLKAYELQPGIPDAWEYENTNRPIDVLFYGQFTKGWKNMFDNRNELIEKLIRLKKNQKHTIKIALQYNTIKSLILKLLYFKFEVARFPSRYVRKYSDKPLYSNSLYNQIIKSKIVVNAYTNYNNEFKSNMRIFEAIGHGAFLISERGNYPDGLEPDVDFYTYDGFVELKEKIDYVLSNWDEHRIIALKSAEKIRTIFSKENQWKQFQKIVNSIK